MQENDLNYDTTCTVCEGDGQEPAPEGSEIYGGTCPLCGGDGVMNRVTDAEDGMVLLNEEYVNNGVAGGLKTEQMAVRDEETGGFEGRFGPWTPSDMTTGGKSEYEQDLKDQISGTGLSGTYTLPNGKQVDIGAQIPNPAPPTDMTIDQIISWMRARGDETIVSRFEKIQQEKANLP